MSDTYSQSDTKSDDLISIFTDLEQSRLEREKASVSLYHRHESWVLQQIRKRIHSPDDALDIAQDVWYRVLNPQKLAEKYTKRDGKFRAYLRQPINWCILKHIDKLPFTTDATGEKQTPLFVDIEDETVDIAMDECLLEDTIKNYLPAIGIKQRNVYVVNEYRTVFKNSPTVRDVAEINGLSEFEAGDLLTAAVGKTPDRCSDNEQSVHLPMNYKTLVDQVELKRGKESYLAALMGISDAAFRKRMFVARSRLMQGARVYLDGLGVNDNG